MNRQTINLVADFVGVNNALSALPSASVQVLIQNSDGSQGSQATVYQGPTGSTPAQQPLTTDNQGRIPGYLEPGDYILQITYPNQQTQTATYAVPLPASQLGQPNSMASLDSTGRLPVAQTPLSVVTGASHYDLGKDTAHNMAIGSAFSSIVPSPSSGAGFNVAYGNGALGSLTTAAYNTAIGDNALAALTAGPTGGEAAGGENTAVGQSAAKALVDAQWCVAVGRNALQASIHDYSNTMIGWAAGALITSADGSATENVGVGSEVLNNATRVQYTTAIGHAAMANGIPCTTANSTAVGHQACFQLTSGTNQTAVGAGALFSATVSGSCTAIGAFALHDADSTHNTAIGAWAGQGPGQTTGITSGTDNVYVGYNCGPPTAHDTTQATGIGSQAICSDVGVAIGYKASATAGGNVAIGFQAIAVNNAIAIGYNVQANGQGSIAIGVDNAGTSVTTSTANVIALGTALHQLQLRNNTTGSGSAALGSNCPAVTASAPYTWFKMMSSDGSTVYVPAWK